MLEHSLNRILKKRVEVEQIPRLDEKLSFRKNECKSLVTKYLVEADQSNWFFCGFVKDSDHSRCNQHHRDGVVVELLDGRRAVIGNDCIDRHFSETESLYQERTRFDNGVSLTIALKKGTEIVNSPGKVSQMIRDAERHLDEMLRFKEEYQDVVGRAVVRRLDSSSNAQGILSVTVALINDEWVEWNEDPYFYQVDKQPQKYINHEVKVGAIAGLSCIGSNLGLLSRELRRHKSSFDSYITSGQKIMEKDLKRLPRLVDSIRNCVGRINREYQKFSSLKNKDFSSCALLESDRERRIRIIMWARKLTAAESKKLLDALEEFWLRKTSADHFVYR